MNLPGVGTHDESILASSFEEKIKELSPSEQEAVKNFWRSVVMRTPRTFSEENGRLPQCANVRSCSCCPYGYHIDLDFVRYCESLANAKPSEEELRRRSRRRSRKSMEFMLGFESLFDQWDVNERVQALPEVAHESESDTPHLPLSTTARYSGGSGQRPRSSSVPRYTYGTLTRPESPFGTASSTCSSLRGAESDAAAFPMRHPANSPPETRAFLRDALDEVCSDFERTLERASVRRKKAASSPYGLASSMFSSLGSDRNNNHHNKSSNGYSSCLEKRNCQAWDQDFDVFDSCVAGNKSPRSSQSFGKTSTLPFQQKLSPAEQQYESYVQATVAANAKSPVEVATPPPPPPRRHALTTKSPLIDKLISPVSSTTDATSSADAQTLYNIRQQMALSLKRMKDLEEQVKSIPELQHELSQLRNEKQHLQQNLHRKDEELQRARETTRLSSSPSPVASPKYASPVQFTPQRISPISLESLGARLRTNSNSSERQLKSVLKRDVGTMCGLRTTRDVAVGSPLTTLRTVGTSPALALSLTEALFTQLQMEERIRVAIQHYEEQRTLQQLKKLISVGTQMYVPKRDSRDSGMQTAPEKPVLKYTIGVSAKPTTRESFMQCKPSVRSVASSEDRVTDVLCEKCAVSKRTVAISTEDAPDDKGVSLKLLDLPGRSYTFTLGDNEKLNIKRKTIGTQYTPVAVHNAGSQTSLAVVHTVGVQHVPEMVSATTQSHIACAHRQTDTRDLIRLCATQTSTEEVATPAPIAPTPPPPPPLPQTKQLPAKPRTRSTASNTDARKTTDNGVNTLPPVSTKHSASNTEEVHKRDIACGDIVKPHISIACADNYCDSCKDAIKHLAKDFSKVLTSPVAPRAVDSKIPRPKHLTSPSPARRLFQRQNTYTITPSPTPSPVAEKKSLTSSLHEKPPAVSNFHQLESCRETKSFITEPTGLKLDSTRRPAPEELKGIFPQEDDKPFDLKNFVEGDLIVKEEKRVRICWSRDASPSPLKSLESSFNEKLVEPVASADTQSAALETSKGARKKTLPLKSSQTQDVPKQPEEGRPEEKPISKALLQKLAMVEAEPRKKCTPTKEMLAAVKTISDSLLKKMGSKAFSSASLKASKLTIQQEWFRISSTDKANPHEVEDYLDCFEEFSVPLLEYCVNLTDNNGNTAMHYAVSHGNFDVVSILLDSKVCNVNQMNNAGYTCVMLVSLAKLKNAAHRTVVERLFQMADVNIRAKKHCQTALMLAVSHGNLDMVEMLLGAGADINIQDEDGSTALMCAAEHGRVDIVKHLLSQTDCDSLIQDMDGSTAFKIAWQAGHRDIGLLLYVHEQMLRSKLPNRGENQRTPSLSPRQHKRQPSQ